jgi:hypothetical protein
MIKASDYRIGNIIYQNGKITIIDSLERSVNDWDRTNYKRTIDTNPIPLTEEWLLKFGFDYYKSNNSYQLDTKLGFSIWGRIISGFNVYYESDEIGETFKYVHQLQNLIFALTGNELTMQNNE